MDLKKNRSFCILPFIHISVVGKKIKPCCRFSPDSQIVIKYLNDSQPKQGIKDIFFSSNYQQLRKKMIGGRLVEGCYKCYQEERAGGSSIRLNAYDDFKHLLPADLKPGIKFLEIGFGNLCNLRCRTCASGLSTGWFREDKLLEGKFGRRPFPGHESQMNRLKSKDLLGLKYIKIVGGEPLINSNFVAFVERLVKLGVNKNSEIDLFTNVSYFPKPDLVNKLLSFKVTKVHLSIDAYGEKNEYIRNPSQWSQVETATRLWLEKIKNHPNLLVTLENTVSIYNAYYLEEIFDWWMNLNQKAKTKERLAHFICVATPEYLSIINLPQEIKQILDKKFSILIDKYKDDGLAIMWLKNIKAIMHSKGKNKLKEFYSYTKEIDKLREENYEKLFPEFYQLIEKYI